MKKSVFALGLMTSALLSCHHALAVSTCTADEENCWDCGKTASDSCTARLNGTNLTITGSGEMMDYKSQYYDQSINYGYSDVPWGQDITSVTIGEGITSIGDKAFQGSNLVSATLPSTLTNISKRAFQFSKKLENINIPSSVTNIGDYSFDTCTNITSFTIPDGITSINPGIFMRTGLTSIVIPDSVTEIKWSVFDGASNLQSIFIGNNVTSIGPSAFLDTSAYIYCQESGHGGKSCAELIGKNNPNALNKLKIYS
ncbi:MAG: leucine-rich repeat domain-containing protein, partial [Alphaproteobacteria bacterium]|nr:leucine-rich repeat domain-containing protein [Alphaproteobacteria bacterium]